jgi:hypothetical protein
MVMEWRGESGFGGLPHLSYIKRKPIPLGTLLKSVCEGTMGMCIFIEIQKGKIAMYGSEKMGERLWRYHCLYCSSY